MWTENRSERHTWGSYLAARKGMAIGASHMWRKWKLAKIEPPTLCSQTFDCFETPKSCNNNHFIVKLLSFADTITVWRCFLIMTSSIITARKSLRVTRPVSASRMLNVNLARENATHVITTPNKVNPEAAFSSQLKSEFYVIFRQLSTLHSFWKLWLPNLYFGLFLSFW